jgi:hypothetical protein
MRRATVLTLLTLTLLLSAAPASLSARAGVAQGDYDLSWWTVDGGGGSSPPGSGYSLGGTVGQPDAAVWAAGGGSATSYSLSGGFWVGSALQDYVIYLPVVLRGG